MLCMLCCAASLRQVSDVASWLFAFEVALGARRQAAVAELLTRLADPAASVMDMRADAQVQWGVPRGGQVGAGVVAATSCRLCCCRCRHSTLSAMFHATAV